MMRLTEDYLTDNERDAIDKVLESKTPRFDFLVKEAGLDPKKDLKYSDFRRLDMCGADLRGFDFTGCDLRQCIRNTNTFIDDTTTFKDALLDWIEIEALPIVMKMQEVEAASTSEQRRRLLSELTNEFGNTVHVVTYMASAATRSKTLDQFIDFVTFLPRQLPEVHGASLRDAAKTLLRKRFAQSKVRTRRESTKLFTAERIATQLSEAKGSLAEQIYHHLSEIVLAKQQTSALKGMASVEPNDLERAFGQIGR